MEGILAIPTGRKVREDYLTCTIWLGCSAAFFLAVQSVLRLSRPMTDDYAFYFGYGEPRP